MITGYCKAGKLDSEQPTSDHRWIPWVGEGPWSDVMQWQVGMGQDRNHRWGVKLNTVESMCVLAMYEISMTQM